MRNLEPWQQRLNIVHRTVHAKSDCPFDAFEEFHKNERDLITTEIIIEIFQIAEGENGEVEDVVAAILEYATRKGVDLGLNRQSLIEKTCQSTTIQQEASHQA